MVSTWGNLSKSHSALYRQAAVLPSRGASQTDDGESSGSSLLDAADWHSGPEGISSRGSLVGPVLRDGVAFPCMRRLST